MKKTLELISLFIPLALIFGIGYSFDVSVSLPIESLTIYAICLLSCPILGLCRLSPLARGTLFGVSVFAYAVGVGAALLFGSPLLAQCVLGIGTFCMGTLLVFFALPNGTGEETHLLHRGLRPSHARRTLLKQQSYAFFFQKSGLLFGITTLYSLFIEDSLTVSSLFSGALFSILVGILGVLLYCLLGAPACSRPQPTQKKSTYIFGSLLVFFLILILIYVYVGSLYTSPDPALRDALFAVQQLLTPVLLGCAFGVVLGTLLGFLLSLFGVRVWTPILGGVEHIPFALWTVLVYSLAPSMPHGAFGAICLVQALCTALCILRARRNLLPFRVLPIQERRRALTLPLLHLPCVALWPTLLLSGTISALCIKRASLAALGELPLAFLAAIVSVILCILLILTYLTKEVHHNA